MNPPQTVTDWVGVIIAAGTLLLGGGGLGSYLKVLSDRKKIGTDTTREDNAALNARAVAIVQAQVEYLIEPLQKKVDDLEKKLADAVVRGDLYDRKYRHALAHIRDLLSWIGAHLPDRSDFPEPPADIAGDL